MTLDEIADLLPNGFHDSEIRGISVDYVRREATIKWTVDLTDPEEPHKQPATRDVTVVLRGVKYFFIEAPQANYPFECPGSIDVTDSVDSSVCDATGKPLVSPELLSAAPHQRFANSLFVNDWNSFIHIAADEAELMCAQEDFEHS
jgi:hypothetical protein